VGAVDTGVGIDVGVGDGTGKAQAPTSRAMVATHTPPPIPRPLMPLRTAMLRPDGSVGSNITGGRRNPLDRRTGG
jgi:hypothetical protein